MRISFYVSDLHEVSRHLRSLGEHKTFWMAALQTRVWKDLPVPFPSGFDCGGYDFNDLKAFARRLAHLEATWARPSHMNQGIGSVKVLTVPESLQKAYRARSIFPLFLPGTPLMVVTHYERLYCFLIEEDTITEKACIEEKMSLAMFQTELDQDGCILFAAGEGVKVYV